MLPNKGKMELVDIIDQCFELYRYAKEGIKHKRVLLWENNTQKGGVVQP